MEAKKENHKESDDSQAQLEDVQQAYTMDEIQFEEKYEDLLGRYQNERDTERRQYEDLIHGKDGDQRDLQKVLSEIRRECENQKREQDKLEAKVNEITRERRRELDTNAKQTSWFLQKLSSRIIEINKILQQKGQAKKNSDLQKILANLSDELEKSERREECLLCIQNKHNCALQPCGHKDLCKSCADKLDGTCHVCREKIENILLIYS